MSTDELERGAQAIREAVEVYRGLVAVADILESLGPLEEAEVTLRGRLAELQEQIGERSRELTEWTQRANAARAEYEKTMRQLERDVAVREREFEAELQIRHADRIAALAALDAEIAAKSAQHAAVTEQVERLRRLFA